MLAYIPKVFATYRQVKRRLHAVLEHLVAHADRAGRCWPSSRTLAELIGDISKSTVARYLNELVRDGHATRQREKRPGGGWHFVYTVAAQFLPATRDRSGVPKPDRAVSHPRGTEEKPLKKREAPPVLTDDLAQWERRLQAWRKSGSKFWNAFWGPKPNEPGCFVPPALLTS
jgi:hypothetical protein